MLRPDFIELKNIRKRFGSTSASPKILSQTLTEVLKDISLTISQSSITGIIGRSGAGKSTLLRCLTLLEKPDSGEILLQDRDLVKVDSKELNQVRRKFGFIPQSIDLLNYRTLRKNIALPLEIAGELNNSEIHSRVQEVAEIVGIGDKLDAYPRQLSGGQKQRAAIARALITKPALLLCDEFTSALDPETTLEILNLLLEIRNSTGVTIILITHDMSVLIEICDFIYVLDEGRLVDQGSVTTLLRSPKHSVTRNLLRKLEAV